MEREYIQIGLLGRFAVTAGTTTIDRFPTDKVRALLAYLVAEADRAHPRSHLATLLWGDWDEAAARSNLRKSLFRLRKVLSKAIGAESAETQLTITRTTVQFNRSATSVDLHQFTQLTQNDTIADLIRASELYRGRFLAGLEIVDAPEFDEWLTVRREQLHQQQLTVLTQLGELHLAQRDYEATIAVARQQLALEAWREVAHRQLMRAYDGSGQRTAALAQYEQCRAILETELGIEPSAETEHLIDAIRGEQLLTTHLHHFTIPHTPFVGREADLNRLVTRLNTPDVRLVTLTGPGGIGKTRLAIEAVRRTVGNRSAYFLPLSEAKSQDDIWQLLAEHLEIKPSSQRSLVTDVVAFVRARAPLLVLDNYEQLLPNTHCIEHLLSHATDVQILVTSRAPLNLRAEWRLPLEGLDIPAVGTETIADFPAVQLLLTTGQQVAPAFVLSAENKPHIIRICRALAGMPLALEMAGSWFALFTPDLLAEQIEQNLDFLVATRTDIPDRHRSLRAIFDHTLAQLTAIERTLIHQLTLFHGDFSLKAIITILSASPLALNALIDHALLQRRGDNRFGLHPLVTSFLRESKVDDVSLQRRFATYFLQHIATINADNIANTVAEISRNRANVRAAWQWAVAQAQIELLTNALDGLLAFYRYRGSYLEGQTQFALAADTLPRSPLTNRLRLAEATCLQQLGELEGAIAIVEQIVADNDATRLPAMTRLARLYERHTDHEAAIAMAQEALQLARPISAESAQLWHILGLVYQYRGSLDKRLQAHKQILAINEVLGDHLGISEGHSILGLIYKDQGDYDKGIEHTKKAIEIVETLNFREKVAQYTNNLGRLYTRQREYEQAKQAYQRGYHIATELDHKQLLTISLGNLASIAKMERDYETALANGERAINLAKQIGDRASQAVFLGNRGHALVDCGHYAEGIAHFERAAAIDREIKAFNGVGRHLTGIGEVLQYQGRFAEALAYFEQAIPYLRQSDAKYYLGWALVVYAECLFAVGDFAKAQKASDEGGRLAEETGREYYIVSSQLLSACLLAQSGDRQGALAHIERLQAVWGEFEELSAEIHLTRWQITGDENARAIAQTIFDQLYATTKRDRYRARMRTQKLI